MAESAAPIAPTPAEAASNIAATSGTVVVAPVAIPVSPAGAMPASTPIDNDSGGQFPKGFRFGSYGRVSAATDLRGGKPEAVAVVADGPRIVEPNYFELDFQYGFTTPSGMHIRTVTTLAYDDDLFHDTGNFQSTSAIRNLFAEAELGPHLTAWIGSRMYRGDDIYLFDQWPLDNQNTVGGGVAYKPHRLEVLAHVGFNRLLNPFQYQTIEVPDPAQGATTVTQLNRERTVGSASVSYLVLDRAPSELSLKLKLHTEVSGLPSGSYERTDGSFEALPKDYGFLIGGEASFYGMSADARFHRHINLFARYAAGLAAYDPLSAPSTFDASLKTFPTASEVLLAMSSNWDMPGGNLMFAAKARRFIDASGNTNDDVNDGWEYAIDARPLVKATHDLYLGADISYQVRFPDGINATSQLAEDPAVFQIAPMAVWSPMGPSAYDRPQLRLVYRAAFLNQGALDQYVPDDPRHDHAWVHYLGLQAEWWFNSSYR